MVPCTNPGYVYEKAVCGVHQKCAARLLSTGALCSLTRVKEHFQTSIADAYGHIKEVMLLFTNTCVVGGFSLRKLSKNNSRNKPNVNPEFRM